jgi:4,5-dihydroxyphthalate decarboxylase
LRRQTTTRAGRRSRGADPAPPGGCRPRAPSSFTPSNPHLRWVIAEPTRAAMEYYRRTRIFPIMNIVGLRRSILGTLESFKI